MRKRRDHIPKIYFGIGLGELYDRISILHLKQSRLGLLLKEEERAIADAIEQYRQIGIEANNDLIGELTRVNEAIWDLEAVIRRGLSAKLPMNEIGKRAVKIRDLNERRADLRNRINRETGSGFEEPVK
jgi:hypothetical protein